MIINIPKNGGQLANQLFSFASLMHVASSTKQILLNPAFDDYCEFFEGTKKGTFPVYYGKSRRLVSLNLSPVILKSLEITLKFARKFKLRNRLISYINFEREKISLDTIEREISRGFINFVEGWGGPKFTLTDQDRESIHVYFKAADIHFKRFQEFILKEKEKNTVLVGIHIRRGDYRKFEGGIYCFEDEEYKMYMEKFQKLIFPQRVKFIICSNEKIVLENFVPTNAVAGLGHLVEDLYLLSLCDYIIGPPSTYSQWASFYGRVPLFYITKHGGNYRNLEMNVFKVY
jgi:hypothetical protein